MEKRSIARAIFILWMLHSFIYFSLEEDDFSLLYDTCSARNFCKANATKVNNELNTTSCCQDCSCESTCLLAGNCCPDFEFEHGDKDVPQLACTRIQDLLNSGRLGLGFDSDYSGMYHIIDYCPQDTQSSYYTVWNCLYPRTLEGYIPVSSSNGELLFKNRDCAHCHGFTDIVPWNLALNTDCLDVVTMDFRSSLEMDEYILSTCFLDAKPSDPKYAKKVSCYAEPVNDRCNTSGDWNVYDSDIESKCHENYVHMHTQYYEPRTGKRIAPYSNVYCFYCNRKFPYTQLESYNSDVCPVRTNKDRRTTDLRSAFSVLLKVHHHDGKQERNNPCLETEAYDPHSKVCRRVLCRWGYFPLNGRCEPLGQFEGVYFSVFFTGALNFDLSDKETEAGVAFVNKLSTGILPGCETKFCHPSLYMLFDKLPVFTTAFVPTQTCGFDRLLDAMHALRGGEFTLEVRANSTTRRDLPTNIKLKTVTESIHVDFEDSYFVFEGDSCGQVIGLDLDMLDPCPKIELPVLELNKLFDKGTADVLIENQISSKYDDDREQIITLCVSDYLDITQHYLNSAISGRLCAGLLAFAVVIHVILYKLI